MPDVDMLDVHNHGRKFTSTFYGVSWHKSSQRWAVQIRHDGKRIHVGYYPDEIEAAKAYDQIAIRLRGDTTRLNFDADGNRVAPTVIAPGRRVDYDSDNAGASGASGGVPAGAAAGARGSTGGLSLGSPMSTGLLSPARPSYGPDTGSFTGIASRKPSGQSESSMTTQSTAGSSQAMGVAGAGSGLGLGLPPSGPPSRAESYDVGASSTGAPASSASSTIGEACMDGCSDHSRVVSSGASTCSGDSSDRQSGGHGSTGAGRAGDGAQGRLSAGTSVSGSAPGTPHRSSVGAIAGHACPSSPCPHPSHGTGWLYVPDATRAALAVDPIERAVAEALGDKYPGYAATAGGSTGIAGAWRGKRGLGSYGPGPASGSGSEDELEDGEGGAGGPRRSKRIRASGGPTRRSTDDEAEEEEEPAKERKVSLEDSSSSGTPRASGAAPRDSSSTGTGTGTVRHTSTAAGVATAGHSASGGSAGVGARPKRGRGGSRPGAGRRRRASATPLDSSPAPGAAPTPTASAGYAFPPGAYNAYPAAWHVEGYTGAARERYSSEEEEEEESYVQAEGGYPMPYDASTGTWGGQSGVVGGKGVKGAGKAKGKGKKAAGKASGQTMALPPHLQSSSGVAYPLSYATHVHANYYTGPYPQAYGQGAGHGHGHGGYPPVHPQHAVGAAGRGYGHAMPYPGGYGYDQTHAHGPAGGRRLSDDDDEQQEEEEDGAGEGQQGYYEPGYGEEDEEEEQQGAGGAHARAYHHGPSTPRRGPTGTGAAPGVGPQSSQPTGSPPGAREGEGELLLQLTALAAQGASPGTQAALGTLPSTSMGMGMGMGMGSHGSSVTPDKAAAIAALAGTGTPAATAAMAWGGAMAGGHRAEAAAGAGSPVHPKPVLQGLPGTATGTAAAVTGSGQATGGIGIGETGGALAMASASSLGSPTMAFGHLSLRLDAAGRAADGSSSAGMPLPLAIGLDGQPR